MLWNEFLKIENLNSIYFSKQKLQLGSAAVNNNQPNKNMSSFIELNNKPKLPQSQQPQQNMLQKPMFLNQSHINSPQSAFNNVLPNNNNNHNMFNNNQSQFISSPSEFQPPSSKHNQFSRSSNNPTPNNNVLFNHHLNQLPNSISSPICNPSSPLTAISLSSQPAAAAAAAASSQHQLHQFQNQSQKSTPINLDPSQSSNAKRPSFIARNHSNAADRKPEELDALANELLNEFSSSRKNDKKLGTTNAPLSRLSSSSSSSSSTARSSSSSSSSSSNESGELIAPHISDLNEHETGSSSQTPSSAHSSDSHHSSASVTNKSGTLIIHRDGNSSSHFSEKIKNLKIDNLPDLLLTQQQQQQQQQSNNNNNFQKFILPDPTTSCMPQTFVSYNPNSKSIISQLGVSCSGGSSFDNSGIPPIASLSGATASNVPSLGIGSVIQPLNESQLRKGNQVSKNIYKHKNIHGFSVLFRNPLLLFNS